MTAMNDQDRRIAAWFEDVPSRVPERTIEAALAHARAHPRRRDPLAALRRDPMGSGGFGLGRMAQPLPLVAALGLLLAAAFVGATVGRWFQQEPAVVPPVVTPSPSASVAPTASPTPQTIRVDLIEHSGNDAFIDITDESFTLVEAVSGDPGNGVDVPGSQPVVENDPSDPATVILTWASASCDTDHTMVIEADGRTISMSRSRCEGDAIGGLGHVLRLTFDAPASASEFAVTLETTP
jgi:hypothetical protein